MEESVGVCLNRALAVLPQSLASVHGGWLAAAGIDGRRRQAR